PPSRGATRFPYTTLFRSEVVQPRMVDPTGESIVRVGRQLRVRWWKVLARGKHPQGLRKRPHVRREPGRADRVAHHLRGDVEARPDRKSTRLNSSHVKISY